MKKIPIQRTWYGKPILPEEAVFPDNSKIKSSSWLPDELGVVAYYYDPEKLTLEEWAMLDYDEAYRKWANKVYGAIVFALMFIIIIIVFLGERGIL